MTDTTQIDLTQDVNLPTSGHTIEVALPSGLVLSLWVYESEGTTSVDVRALRADQMDVLLPLEHVLLMPSDKLVKTVGCVIENRALR